MKVIRNVETYNNGLTRVLQFTREGEEKPYYIQIVQFDETSGFTSMWFDTNMHSEKFKITQTGVNKKGEPVWQVDYIDSTVAMYIDGVKYQDKASYDEACIQQLLVGRETKLILTSLPD